MPEQRPTPEQLAEWRRLLEQREYCPEHNPYGVPDAPLFPECSSCWSDDELWDIATALLAEVERLRVLLGRARAIGDDPDDWDIPYESLREVRRILKEVNDA